MNTSILQKALASALVALAFAATAAPASAGPIALTITPSAPVVDAGADFYVDVVIQGVTDLFGFGIILTIDDLTKATFRGTDSDSFDADDDPTNEGPFLSSGFDPITLDPNLTFYFDQYLAPSSVYVSNSILGSAGGVTGDGVLFRAFFTAGQNPGPVIIDFGASPDVTVALFDSTIDANGNPGVITPTDSSGARIEIAASTTAVPEPATVGLVGLGLAAMWRRRRAQRRTSPSGTE